MPPLRKPSSIGGGKPSQPTPKPLPKPTPPPTIPVVKAAPKPIAKPVAPPPDMDVVKKLHREADAPNVNKWMTELSKKLKLSSAHGTDLIAIGVKMSQHERDTLLRILTT